MNGVVSGKHAVATPCRSGTTDENIVAVGFGHVHVLRTDDAGPAGLVGQPSRLADILAGHGGEGRASRSVDPPALKGTIRLMGCSGNAA